MHAKQRWHVNLFARAKRRSVARRPRQVVGLLVAGAMVIAVASEICWAERGHKNGSKTSVLFWTFLCELNTSNLAAATKMQ